jgi:hypothetical protein
MDALIPGGVSERGARRRMNAQRLVAVVTLILIMSGCTGSPPAAASFVVQGARSSSACPETEQQARCIVVRVVNMGDARGSETCRIEERGGSPAWLAGDTASSVKLEDVAPGDSVDVLLSYGKGDGGAFVAPQLSCPAPQ